MNHSRYLLNLLLPAACLCFSPGVTLRSVVHAGPQERRTILPSHLPVSLQSSSTSTTFALNQTEPIPTETKAQNQPTPHEIELASAEQTPAIVRPVTESTLRSIVKSLCWRFIAGSITFATTLQFSKSTAVAFQVVGADFLSKSTTMFLGERLMNKSQAGRQTGADDASRSLAKALIWRAFAITNTLFISVFVSKDLSVASKIASTDAVFKTALMYLYERAWAHIQWGKSQKQPKSWRRSTQARFRALKLWLYRHRVGGRRLAWSYSI